ncbi:MAG TPA: hypothetical protein VFV93_17050 [Thermomicrobiales bacterium]|nr:hypothetical protein [Thermomicrobiales bacterium]
MPDRPRHKRRRRLRGGYPETMFSRYLRSPYDPDNSRNMWGYIVGRTLANPPRRGAGRWFAWIQALVLCASGIAGITFGLDGDLLPLAFGILFGIAGIVVLSRLIGSRRH